MVSLRSEDSVVDSISLVFIVDEVQKVVKVLLPILLGGAIVVSEVEKSGQLSVKLVSVVQAVVVALAGVLVHVERAVSNV